MSICSWYRHYWLPFASVKLLFSTTSTLFEVPESFLPVMETDWSRLATELVEVWLLANENGTVTMNAPPKFRDARTKPAHLVECSTRCCRLPGWRTLGPRIGIGALRVSAWGIAGNLEG